jgi:hypothetical protein
MSTVKKGKMPISQKYESNDIQEDFGGDPLKLSRELRKELEDQGLVGRWLNAKKLQSESGFHQSGWKVYKRPESVRNQPRGSLDYLEGMDPEGYVRYRDLVLGCKTIESHERNKRVIADKNARLSNHKERNKRDADAIRYRAREGGLDAKVTEGYDESSGYKEIDE